MQRPVDIRPLRDEDAGGLVHLFERCYGDSYVAEEFYDAARIRNRVAARLERSEPPPPLERPAPATGGGSGRGRTGHDSPNPEPASILTSHFDPRRRLLRLDIEHIGADLSAQVAAARQEHPADVIHADLPLHDRRVEQACELLWRDGYFLCARLPEYAEGDVLRLQRLAAPTEAQLDPQLATAGGHSLLARLAADRTEA